VDADGATPIVIAAQHNQVALVKFLDEIGANMEIGDCNGDIHLSAYKGHGLLLEFLSSFRPQDVDCIDICG
jgi:ankyrin repeat protein